jgi:hypothetical protein
MTSTFMPLDHYKNACVVPDDKCGDLIDETLAVWQQRTTRQLTREDEHQIIENMVGFFRVLREWDDADGLRRRRMKNHS